jgi:four helix bundle protein
MESEGTVLHKSFLFAKRIVKLYKHPLAQGQLRALADQLLRSGTFICANMEEATGGFSRRDFAANCSVAYKEARETHYWLRLLSETECLGIRLAESMLNDAEELRKMLSAIVRSTRENS